MSREYFHKLFIIIIIIGFGCSTFILFQRNKIERINKNIELCLDFSAFKEFCYSHNLDIFSTLGKFTDSGITTVALDEESIVDLEKSGKIYYKIENGKVYIQTEDKSTYDWLYTWLNIKLNKRTIKKNNFLEISSPLSYLENTKISINYDDYEKIQKLKLFIIPRLNNFYNLSDAKITKIFDTLPFTHTIIFSGDEVLGYKDYIKIVADCMNKKNINFGYVEFAEQYGEKKLGVLLQNKIIRVHSINIEEIRKMDSKDAINRFIRAVKERNIRICYIRPFLDKDLEYNLKYITELKKGLEKGGFKLGKVTPYDKLQPNKILISIIFLSIIATFLITLTNLVSFHNQLIALILLTLISVISLFTSPTLTKKIMALFAGIIYPVYAIVMCVSGREEKNKNNKIGFVIYKFLAVTTITFTGGIFIAAILSETKFILKIDQYQGVKLSFILPIFFIFLIIIHQFFNLIEFLKKPILIYHTIIIGIILVIIAVMITRTGHEVGLFTTDYELKFRTVLENMLFYRPRIKEFLFAHPILILGFYYLLKDNKHLSALFIILGSIGQVSIINTFCHLHTPIYFSILRIINGIIIGMILGIILCFIVDRILSKLYIKGGANI